MFSKENYIRTVLVVFWLLILTRIPAFYTGSQDVVTVISTLVELGLFIWGMVILRRSARSARQP